MKQYTVAYIKNGKEYAYDKYISHAPISNIVKELIYEINYYGIDYDEIDIFVVNDYAPDVYFVTVKKMRVSTNW